MAGPVGELNTLSVQPVPPTVIAVKPSGTTPVTVIEFGTVTGPAVAASHTVASKLTACPACRFVPLLLTNEIVSSGGVVVGTGVGVAVGVGAAVTMIVDCAVLLFGFGLFGSLTVAEVVKAGIALLLSVPVIASAGKQLPGATG